MKSFLFLPVTLASVLEAAPQEEETTPRSLTLAEAVELAERTSEEVQAASARLARSTSEIDRAEADRFPQLFGSFTYTRTLASQFGNLRDGDETPPDAVRPPDCGPFVPDPSLDPSQRIDALGRALECVANATPDFGGSFEDLPFGRENQYVLGLSLSQPIYTGGRIGAAIRAASAGLTAAEVNLSAARARLALDVVEAYFDAALNERVVAIAEATLEQAQATFQQTQIAYRVGAQAEFDMLRASVASENQEPIVIEARADRDLAHLRLKQLLDLPETEPVVLTTALGDDRLPPLRRLASLPEGVEPEPELPPETSARSPVRQALATLRLREAQLRIASAARRPSVTLFSSYGLITFPETPVPSFRSVLNDWTVSVGAEVPIFTGGRLQAEEDVARADLEEARAEMERTVELTAFDTAEALERLRAAEARLQATAGTVSTAVRAYQIAEVRYREGISTQLELTDTRLQLQQAEVNRARAARDVRVAEARVALLPYLPLSTQPVIREPVQPLQMAPEFQTPSPSLPGEGSIVQASSTRTRTNQNRR